MERMTQETAYLAIGSNLDPIRNIRRCLALLRTISNASLILESSWYLTRPWGIVAQPDFVNLVVGLETGLSPHQLLAATQDIETRLGRLRTLPNGPRTIDLDLLLFGNILLDQHELRIPHPGLLLRDFMALPLLEIAPQIVHPVRGLPLNALTREIRYRQIVAQLPAEQQTATPPNASVNSLYSGFFML